MTLTNAIAPVAALPMGNIVSTVPGKSEVRRRKKARAKQVIEQLTKSTRTRHGL